MMDCSGIGDEVVGEGAKVLRPLTMRRQTEGRELAEDEATGELEEARAWAGAYEGTNLFLQSLQIDLRRLSSSSESDATAQCK